MNIQEELRKPFNENEIEWRVQQCGLSNGKPWAMVLCYVQARAIQNRLDKVFGWNNWQVEYKTCNGDNNILCRISAYDKEKGIWIYKEDGASESNVEPFKGGISGALKRCASSGFGIGRYLYNLTENFAECSTEAPPKEEKHLWKKALTKERKTIYWKIPKLPSWALPPKATKKDETDLINLGSKANISHKMILSVINKDYGVKSIQELDIDQYNEVYKRINDKIK